ncbi:hypothetical protein [Marinobacter sp. BSs20148]|jgi:hypothetical protein|nr:hypothetical protein [Marinobacter sp. BSs20148]AFP30928.1 hypothetical protein MRBBS_1991 [Marinobacter sp. BSs20148]
MKPAWGLIVRGILAFMANQECAIMQEHITARALPLVAIAG